MRTYRYYASLSNGRNSILWTGKAANLQAFIEETEKLFNGTVWEITESGKCQPEVKRDKQFYSMAAVDMGQASRY